MIVVLIYSQIHDDDDDINCSISIVLKRIFYVLKRETIWYYKRIINVDIFVKEKG